MQDKGELTIFKHGIRRVIKVFNPQEEKWFMTIPDYDRQEPTKNLPPEKTPEVVNSCPMDKCLAPQRLKLLESFHTEVKRIMNEENGMVNINLALSRALARIAKGELQCPIETQSRFTSVVS